MIGGSPLAANAVPEPIRNSRLRIAFFPFGLHHFPEITSRFNCDLDARGKWRNLAPSSRALPLPYPDAYGRADIFFNDQGFLQRVDYILGVAGRAPASHYCFDHVTFGAIVVPTLRRVIS